MTNEQLKTLEDHLWNTANRLRASGGIKAADYAVPVLGLIFLRFADNKYSQFEAAINAAYEKDKDTRREREIHQIALEKCGFYLPKTARYSYLLNLPEKESHAKAIREAMESIEEFQNEDFKGVLPTASYFEIEKKNKNILPEMLKSFSDIPKDASGDVFGKIYEYFLGKFAMAEGQKGGQFFTPTSVVRFIVEVIEPYRGDIYDPACGSGGMFVQSAKFVQEANQSLKDIYVYGQEFMGETVRLAKMNLLVNNIRGQVKEVNSYDENPYDGFEKFDFVMANPPFNVKTVKVTTVQNDPRFYQYGLPRNKGKSDKISDANYLWVSLFATSLNASGRAGFVMPNSASDARNAEKDIRKKIVDSGMVDVMVSMPSNMFFTVTLPATLWFFDKGKINTPRRDKILFLDAREVYHQIDRAHREWTADQQQNLAAIVRLYRGEKKRFADLIENYLKRNLVYVEMGPLKVGRLEKTGELSMIFDYIFKNAWPLLSEITDWAKPILSKKDRTKETNELLLKTNLFYSKPSSVESELQKAEQTKGDYGQAQLDFNFFLEELPEKTTHAERISHQKTCLEYFTKMLVHAQKTVAQFQTIHKKITEGLTILNKDLKIKKDDAYRKIMQNLKEKCFEPLAYAEQALQELQNDRDHATWLLQRFPEGEYQDVVGLCKVADLTEVREEQDYSLNAGRYVGVEIEDDKLSEEEFKSRIFELNNQLKQLGGQATILENNINSTIESLF